jgi:hypothetical protein
MVALHKFRMLILVLVMTSAAFFIFARPANASVLLGLLFNEVNDIHVFKRPDGRPIVVVQGRAWGWYHHVTFPASDTTGKQCMQKFFEYISSGSGKQIQFGGYSAGQVVDQPSRTTRTEFSVITECYFR